MSKKIPIVEAFGRFLPLFPATLMLGILSQLFLLAEYDAYILFSWGQVVNDTVLLCAPLLILAAWVYVGPTDSDYTATKKRMIVRFWLTFFCCFFLIALASVLVPDMRKFTVGLFLIYMTWLFYYHLFPRSSDAPPAELNKRNLWRPTMYFLALLMAFALIQYCVVGFYSFFIQNAYVELDNGKQEKIRYMNDKYIIYWDWKVASNNDKAKIIFKPVSESANQLKPN